jgi:uncharacterized protein (TIGR00730 family)
MLGTLLAQRGITLVYGGSAVGLMKIVADACLESGGEVIGVIPRSMVEKEIAHQGLTRLHVVESMHQRKALMADLSDAFLALPGGFGTFDEFFEILTWAQLGLHSKPCALINTAGYFDLLLAMADHAVAEGMLLPENRRAMSCAADPAQALAILTNACMAENA